MSSPLSDTLAKWVSVKLFASWIMLGAMRPTLDPLLLLKIKILIRLGNATLYLILSPVYVPFLHDGIYLKSDLGTIVKAHLIRLCRSIVIEGWCYDVISLYQALECHFESPGNIQSIVNKMKNELKSWLMILPDKCGQRKQQSILDALYKKIEEIRLVFYGRKQI